MALLGSQRTCTRRREGVICGCILNPGLRVTVFSYLHLVCYALLTPVLLRYALSVLCTSGHCFVCCTFLALALCVICTPEPCTLCFTAFLSTAVCALHTPAPYALHTTLCIMQSWALHSVYFTLLWAAEYVTHSWALHVVCYPLLGPAICAVCTPDPYAVLSRAPLVLPTPVPCTLYDMHFCALHCALHAPDPCTLCVTHSLAQHICAFCSSEPYKVWRYGWNGK